MKEPLLAILQRTQEENLSQPEDEVSKRMNLIVSAYANEIGGAAMLIRAFEVEQVIHRYNKEPLAVNRYEKAVEKLRHTMEMFS